MPVRGLNGRPLKPALGGIRRAVSQESCKRAKAVTPGQCNSKAAKRVIVRLFERKGHLFRTHVPKRDTFQWLAFMQHQGAKNFSESIGQHFVIELSHYLKPYGCGMFGLLY